MFSAEASPTHKAHIGIRATILKKRLMSGVPPLVRLSADGEEKTGSAHGVAESEEEMPVFTIVPAVMEPLRMAFAVSVPFPPGIPVAVVTIVMASVPMEFLMLTATLARMITRRTVFRFAIVIIAITRLFVVTAGHARVAAALPGGLPIVSRATLLVCRCRPTHEQRERQSQQDENAFFHFGLLLNVVERVWGLI